MHPVVVLTLWLLGVSLIQLLSAAWLGGAVAACLLAGLVFAPQRVKRLIRRVRVLLLAIFVLFAWFTPGAAVVVDWPLLSPTREGVSLALEHGGRLVAVVCCVALLLEALPPGRLVGGLHVACRPLALIGISPERLALRLLLVLHYVETAGGNGTHDWRTWLVDDDTGAATPMVLHRESYGPADVAVIALLVVGALLWFALRAWR